MDTSERFDRSWRDRCTVEPASAAILRPMIEERHYLHSWPAVVVARLAIWEGPILSGAVIFALPPRQTAVRYGGITWELARLWIDDRLPGNAETWAIGQALRWIRRHRPEVAYIVSYADPSAGHAGTIYRAANFREDGRTDQERKTPRFDYVAGGRRYSRRGHVPEGLEITRVPRVSKHRFVYSLRRSKP